MTSPSQLPDGTPEFFGPFKVEGYLGAGAFGHVFRVSREGEEYALKWLKSDHPPKGDIRMQNEIWALKAADHSAIPKLIAGGEGVESGRPYYVMSLARGITLEAVIEEHRKLGGWLSEQQVANLLVLILDAVAHLQKRGISHRDIKHNNIIVDVSLSRVWLIDLGCCTGPDRPQSAETFWNIGASRFSPPSKLRHPATSHVTHDTFAVGVVGYLMLTRAYPWSVDRGEDAGALLELMERQLPAPIEHINNTYSSDLTNFVGLLLSPIDDHRPDGVRALEKARELQTLVSTRKFPNQTSSRTISLSRVIRDPLHGDIRMTDFEWQLMRSREFQRLRRIKQLGFANLVFPGAEHTRFLHSLGSLYTADKMLRSMEEVYGTITGSANEDKDLRLLARTYALVHDVTHITFGHTLEDELGFFERHDQNIDRINRLLISGNSEIGELLRSTDHGRQTLYHFDPQATIKKRAFVEDLISSSSGADVLDYVDRDAFFCGLDERIDSAIFRRFAFEHSDDGGRLLCQSFGKHGRRLDVGFALENVRMARFALFMKVFTHPVKIAASAMLGKAFGEVRSSKTCSAHFSEDLVENMGDTEIVLRLEEQGTKASAILARRLIARDLYQPVFRSHVMRPDELTTSQHYEEKQNALRRLGLFNPDARRKREREIAKKVGLKPEEVIFYCAPSAPGYSRAIFRISQSAMRVGIKREVLELELLKRHASLWILYVFSPPNVDKRKAEKIVDAVQEDFNLQNELPIIARQSTLPLWTPYGG